MPHGGYHGPKKTKKTKKKATSSGSPHGGGASYSSIPSSSPSQGSGTSSIGQSIFNATNQNNNQQNTVDPKLQAAVNAQASNTQATLPPSMGFQPQPSTNQNTYQDYVNQGLTNQNQIAAQSMMDAGISGLSGLSGVNAPTATTSTGQTLGPAGMPPGEIPPIEDLPPEDDEKEKKEKEKKEKEKKDKALETAQELTNWWKDNGGTYRAYGDRKTLSGEIRNSQKAVTDKIQDKLNKGYYKIVSGPKGEPLIIHASTGTPVNPYTGGIISTQSQGDQGGAYQNEMAKITGIDPKFAGVFSKEYQTGNGLSVSEMKPEHALRFLMKKNKGAFEEFFNMNKEKSGFNPFSASTIGTAFGAILNKITGSEALQVGNNLERAGWGKAIKGKDGKYTIQLTEQGAKNWSNSFNFDTVSWEDDGKLKTFTGFTSPEAIDKDKSKGYLSELLGTKKFPDIPVDLTNLMEQGGYFQGSDLITGSGSSGSIGQSIFNVTNQANQPVYDPNTFDPMNPQGANLATLDPNLNPSVPFQPQYGYMPPITAMGSDSTLPGTPPSQYPEFTPGGYKIGSYNPSVNYSNQSGGDQGQGGGGGGGQDPDTTTPPPGPLTFDVYGRPITYDYTGGPEQIYLGGGYKRDGQYIGSPYGYPTGGVSAYGYSKGGIANFRPYGY